MSKRFLILNREDQKQEKPEATTPIVPFMKLNTMKKEKSISLPQELIPKDMVIPAREPRGRALLKMHVLKSNLNFSGLLIL